MQLNFFKELNSYYWFFSWASIKDRELDYKWNWAFFFNKTIQQNQYYHVSSILLSSLVSNFFGWPISYAQLNWISDRKLEKLAWSTWTFHAIVLYELFMKFSEWKIWIGLWIHSIHRKYMLSHLVNILHCFFDTDIAGCVTVESVHWLKYVLL